MIPLPAMPPADRAALALFCALWLGYGPIARRIGRGAINTGLHSVRVLWMRGMLQRDDRIVDSALIGHVMHSASFFASTSLIAIGALLGVLPLAVLVHGLFKLTWSLRQLNYTVALLGAAPVEPPTAARRNALAKAIGGVMSSAILTFNDGIRSYYFAIVGLAWLAGPLCLAGAAIWLIAILPHRQVGSQVSRQFKVARALVEAEHGAGKDPPGS